MNDVALLESKELKQKAEALFFSTDYSPVKIASLTGCEVEGVRSWIFGPDGIDYTKNKDCWFYKKEILGIGASIAKYRQVEPILIASAKAQSLDILSKQIDLTSKSLSESSTVLDMDQLKKLSDIYEKIDKIDRLEQGRATNITETKLDRMDATDIVAARRHLSDYADIEDIEYKEMQGD